MITKTTDDIVYEIGDMVSIDQNKAAAIIMEAGFRPFSDATHRFGWLMRKTPSAAISKAKE